MDSQSSPVKEYYYRFYGTLVSSGVDEFDNPLGPGYMEVYVQKLEVLSRTPKGVWLWNYGFKRFVLNSARKKFACPTFDEARESFKARKKRQIRILSRQISNAEKALEIADTLREDGSRTLHLSRY